MGVRFLDLQAQLTAYREGALAAMTRVMDSQRFILGAEVEAFEAALGEATGGCHAVGVSSGTDALLMALMDLGVGPGDEVVTTPFSFFATVGAIVRLGATPVFADIDLATFNLDVTSVEARLGPKTKAIIPVHLFGQICDLGRLYTDYPVPVVEDAAQALGSTLGGRGVGHFGDYATLSFFPSKNLGGFGDGGAVLCRNAERAERLRVLRAHGSRLKYFHHEVGGNFRLDALQAAVLTVKLPLLGRWIEARRLNAALYREGFAAEGLDDGGFVDLPQDTPGHSYNQFVIRAVDRDGLQLALAKVGIETAIYYPSPLHLQPCLRDLGCNLAEMPNAERACREVLALPIGPELAEVQIAEVVEAVARFYGG